MQNYVEERFQEPINIVKYSAGQRESAPIDLGVVTRIPVSFVIGTEDTTCPAEQALDIVDEFSNAETFVRYEEGFEHNNFAFDGSKGFIDRMVDTLETGTTE